MFDTEQDVEDTAVDSTTEANDTDYEANSTTEGEAEESTQGDNSSKGESPEAKRARLKRQLAQLDKKHGFKDEDVKEESSVSGQKTDKEAELEEKYNRLALKQDGYTDKAEQDAVIKYAKFEGIEVEDAVKSPVAQAIIKALRDKASTPSPSARTSKNGAPTIDGLIAKYKAGKYLSPTEMKEVRKKLRG